MTVIVLLLIFVDTKWLGTRKTFEWFSTAGRSIKSGLLASSVISAWIWAATLLESSTVAYKYGISGPFWYAAGASIQIILFAVIALELKKRSPSSHTFTEFLYLRLGKFGHKVFLLFALLANSIVMAMLVLGGAVVLNALTGIDIAIACFIIPLSIMMYTYFGGLKATFFADYLNTSFIFIVILILVVGIYFFNPHIGGITGLFEGLQLASTLNPVEGNSGGSFLTLASIGALIFGIINIIGNFGTVFVDQAFWQRAIAARPKSLIKGFFIGGLAWFAIPFALATSLGLAGIAMHLDLSPLEVSHGLVAPMTISALLGEVGGILILTMLFTAVTCAGSAELVAFSSLFTFDVYRTYFKPSASGRQLMRISKYSVLMFGFSIGVLSLSLFHIGLNLQYIYLSMGILIGSAVGPISLSLIWKKTNKISASISALCGLLLGVFVWLFSAFSLYGNISVASTSHDIPLLLGNLTSFGSGFVLVILGSLIKPDNFNYNITKQRIVVAEERIRSLIKEDNDESSLKKGTIFGYKYGIFFTLILVVIWPLPLFFSGYIFSYEFFLFWILLSIVWTISAACFLIVKPIIESKREISIVLSNLLFIIRSKFQIKNYDNKFSLSKNITSENPINTSSKRILVAVDGSMSSIRALDYASHAFQVDSIIYVVHIIEWPDDYEQNTEYDTDLMKRVEKEGRLVLSSILIKNSKRCERVVKIGDPANKIIKTANDLNVDIIVLGTKGLGNSDDLGHVTRKILSESNKPVLLLN
ncbi:MAG: sodium/solute symporter [Candidatus Nitrosocosmicus sp.]|nr:sodium/solute symporter [Candidatus Nitrosocosmicus sp.]MDN5866453.1 sodium/solute symporter [Candidatus Nitrosocosmicus sp.]